MSSRGWQMPDNLIRSRLTATVGTKFHQLTRPASLHQLLPPHDRLHQLPPGERHEESPLAKPTKLRRVRSLSPEPASRSPQSWVECQSLTGWLPRGGMPPVLDTVSSSPTRRIPRPVESGVNPSARQHIGETRRDHTHRVLAGLRPEPWATN